MSKKKKRKAENRGIVSHRNSEGDFQQVKHLLNQMRKKESKEMSAKKEGAVTNVEEDNIA